MFSSRHRPFDFKGSKNLPIEKTICYNIQLYGSLWVRGGTTATENNRTAQTLTVTALFLFRVRRMRPNVFSAALAATLTRPIIKLMTVIQRSILLIVLLLPNSWAQFVRDHQLKDLLKELRMVISNRSATWNWNNHHHHKFLMKFQKENVCCKYSSVLLASMLL